MCYHKVNMSFLDSLTNLLPFGKKEEDQEYFFALNIATDSLTAALWTIEGKSLKVLDIASETYSSNNEIVSVTDKLLDAVLGLKEIEPQKILFGVPNSWLVDDNLKDEYLKILRGIVKELELTPMAYVAVSNALIHFLEKQEGVPTTAIFVGFEKQHLTVTVVRAGKLDGVKTLTRGSNSGADIEKALLNFTDVETLPSKILIYGEGAGQLKTQLLAFPWMAKLSFLHFPKIEVLADDLEIKSICLAGGSEINENIRLVERPIEQAAVKTGLLEEVVEKESEVAPEVSEQAGSSEPSEKGEFGFVVGDVASQMESQPEAGQPLAEKDEKAGGSESQIEEEEPEVSEDVEEAKEEKELSVAKEHPMEVDDFEKDLAAPAESAKEEPRRKFNFHRFLPRRLANPLFLFGTAGAVILVLGAYIFLPKAEVKIFVEPRVLEKDAQVIADPKQKEVNEEGKIIPGEIVSAEVSGSGKEGATGKKEIGDSAKGTVIIRNKTDGEISLSKGTIFSSSNGLKFTLDLLVKVASRSAEDGTWGKATATVTAESIGADGNLSSGSDFTIAGYTSDKMIAKAEGNFSGGTSKDVTVVTDADQKRLLASLTSELRQQAQQKLQEKLPDKKILQEGLSEEIVRKSYSKNINDQASEFSLNLTVKYKGTAFEDQDLKLIVSKLVTTQVPEGFELDLAQTETQADVSKLEKDGKLIFLARFKAKLIPKIDGDKIKDQIKFKTPEEAGNTLKSMENVLGSEINLSPNLPKVLERLPILTRNIKIEIGLK